MKLTLESLLLVTVLCLTGCSREAEAPTASEAVDAARPDAAANRGGAAEPLPPPPRHIAAAAVNVPQQSVVGPADPFLTEQLRIYVRQYGRLPRSFTEFANARLDSIPQPPAGTKWTIDATTTEVKAATK